MIGSHAMLPNELPSHIQPEKLCRKGDGAGIAISGQIKLSNLKGLLKDLRNQPNAIVKVSLLFSMDEEGLCCVKGELQTDLQLICQRCLQAMAYHLQIAIQVSPVSSDQQAAALPHRYEPLWVPMGEISMAEWIAEEIHLALPLAPCHEPSCE
ncbi:MAG: DUF177 domain-containing protein [Proteobacteria bacterium]|nr:DUF177 domain-containing protein [Pseudomonadota bacterium]